MKGSLNGKVAVITGAASGIGRASVLAFADAGAKVLAFDREPAVEELAGESVIAQQGDAGSEADVTAAIERAEAEFGRLDIFYANAGITGGTPGGYFDATPELWLEVLRVNLIGPFLAVKHAAPVIARHGGGAILCTASVAGLRSGAGPAQYSASKAGVINLVQTASQQLAGSGVRINAVCPGLVETGMTQPLFDGARAAGKLDKVGMLNPLGRGGKPGEIAATAMFLCSDAASYITGQALAVDGGLSASHPTARRPADQKGAAW